MPNDPKPDPAPEPSPNTIAKSIAARLKAVSICAPALENLHEEDRNYVLRSLAELFSRP